MVAVASATRREVKGRERIPTFLSDGRLEHLLAVAPWSSGGSTASREIARCVEWGNRITAARTASRQAVPAPRRNRSSTLLSARCSPFGHRPCRIDSLAPARSRATLARLTVHLPLSRCGPSPAFDVRRSTFGVLLFNPRSVVRSPSPPSLAKQKSRRSVSALRRLLVIDLLRCRANRASAGRSPPSRPVPGSPGSRSAPRASTARAIHPPRPGSSPYPSAPLARSR